MGKFGKTSRQKRRAAKAARKCRQGKASGVKAHQEDTQAHPKNEGDDKAANNDRRRESRKQLMELVIQTVIAVTIIGALAVTLISAIRGQSSVLVWVTYGTVILALLVPALYWQKRVWDNPEASSVAGPKLDDPTFTEQVSVAEVWIGGMGSGFPIADLEQAEGKPIIMSGFAPVRLRVKDGKLYANVQVSNGPSLIPIEVRDNRFVVRPPNWDRNSNNTALEVVDETGRPVFQLIDEKPNRIRINGLIHGPNHLLMAGAEGGGTIVNPSPALLAAFKLKPIFKYPSWKYPGQYAE